jgi:hypothetical protein
MKFNLKAAFESLLGSSQDSDSKAGDHEPSSIVLLLREPTFRNLEQLRSAGERAFGRPFVAGESTEFCVCQKVLFTLMRVGPHVLRFMYYTKPYVEKNGQAFANALPLPVQRIAWNQHTSWAAINYAKGPARPEVQYAVLSKLGIEMLDSNCVGAFVPEKRLFILQDGPLLQALQHYASSLPKSLKTRATSIDVRTSLKHCGRITGNPEVSWNRVEGPYC